MTAVNYRAVFGDLRGKDLKAATRNLMQHIAHNRVWSLYSVKEQKQKKAKAYTYGIRKVSNITRSELEVTVTDFLKHAPYQRGGLQYKKKMSDQTTGQNEPLRETVEKNADSN
ncbi:hypothetical protein DPMN_158051 [Dreissena polymorpha]|uniref:Uncharacterized protein n=1 Tax=Dreissena polymorpha TaxID=45954 RepID=A0A9D4EIE3_DREPO|nr:hypothetical protein DPMN_158051 [Dreissena polymorpha]